MNNPPVLIVPGRGNSEVGHWQSILEASLDDVSRVGQAWEINDVVTWAENIDQAVLQLDQPPLIVAHSFGCLATAYARIVLDTPIAAGLFVAPADPARFGIERSILARALGRPGLLVASENDPWLSLSDARSLASDWGLECINLGLAGHINVASGYGRWPFAETLVETLRADLAAIQSTGQSATHSARHRGTRRGAWRSAPLRA